MLDRANRVTRPADFKSAVRTGRRFGTANMVVHVRTTAPGDPVRFGFIITKAVGNAVTRNLVRRRLRSACRTALPTLGTGTDVVVRALPGLSESSWVSLQSEIADSLGRAVGRR